MVIRLTDEMAHPLRHRRIHRVLTHIPLDPEVIHTTSLVLLEKAALHFILVRGIPRAQDHLAAPSHGLRVTAHHADGAEIMQDVFGRDGLRANP